ncbi:hypothetical protein HDU79_009677 [Rhizoclosmatium sp. JEL0117]|nr:hypothetical protein HDU79_009677 [Rhizoclosmatium sp. JEL0117]
MSKGKKLVCRIGSDWNNLAVVNVNDDSNPAFVDGPLFAGNIALRIRDFNGVTPDGSQPIANTDYWGTRKRLFSFQIQGRFKEEINGDDLLQGVIWHRKVKLPFGISIILKVATLVDSTFSHDLTADKPWTYSTTLSSQNTLSVSKAPGPIPSGPLTKTDAEKTLGKWTWGGATELVENNALLRESLNSEAEKDAGLPFGPQDHEKRRKYFQKTAHREGITLSPDYVYTMDTFTPFIDLNTMGLKMGLTLNMNDYTGGQPHTIVFKSKSKNQVFLIMEFRLCDVDSNGNVIIPANVEE